MNAVLFLPMLHTANEKVTPDIRNSTVREEFLYIFEIAVEVQEMLFKKKSVQNESYNNKSDSYSLFHMNVWVFFFYCVTVVV